MKFFIINLLLFGCFYVHADRHGLPKGISLESNITEQSSSEQEKTLRQNNSIQRDNLNQKSIFFIAKDNINLSEDSESITIPDFDSYSSSTGINHGLDAFWKTAFKINAFSDRSKTNTMVSTEIYGKINWQVMNFISIHTQGLIIGRSGFTQSIYDRGDRTKGFHLIESYFNVTASRMMDIRFGRIKQDFLKAPLLITDKTFPSVIEKFSFDLLGEDDFFIIFQQAITDNAVESVKRVSQIIKGVPFFLTSSLFLELKEFSFLNMDVEERFTGFYFSNLSPAIAARSNINGNTIKKDGSDSEFEYDFLGIYNSLSFKKLISQDWILEFGGDIIYNFRAPNKYNSGERIFGALYHNYKNFLEIKLTAEYFANQSDTTVSYFNSEIYGHNNRVGGLMTVLTHFYNSGLTLGISYTRSSAINTSQSTTGFISAFSIFLTTNYMAISNQGKN